MKKFFVFCLFLVLFSCKDAVASADESVMVTEVALKSPAVVTNYKYKEDTDKSISPSSPQMATKIIKKANLRFASEDCNQSFAMLEKAVTNYKATITNDTSGKDFDSSFRNITIRIPNQYFDAFISEISSGVKHFDTKEISQQDVTEEYIDVASRMQSKKKLEERYIQLLSKANKVSEMLEIEKKLAEIREEIEAKEGQLKYLENRVALSTITIEMYTVNASESGATVSYGRKIWNSITSGFNELSNFVLSLIRIWPLILIFVLGFFLLKKRFLKNKE